MNVYEAKKRASEITAQITLARYYAHKAVKAQWRSQQGLKPQHIEASKFRQGANAYLDQHREELVERACSALRTFVQNRKH